MLSGAVLLVANEGEIGASLSSFLAAEGLSLHRAPSLEAARTEMQSSSFGVVVLHADSVPEASPLETALSLFEEIPVVVAATGGARRAVDAIRGGAADFLELPCDREALSYVIGKVLSSHAGDAELPPEPAPATRTFGLLGGSKAMSHVLDVLRRVASGNATVLVRGESGTGKELVARALHAESPRSEGPFVKVHCAGLPETLLESELFGYEKGAFTGATARKPGRAEIAEGGTLFLDEIGDISQAIQVKLLRLLQDREYERLGGAVTLKADVRFVAATHRDLEHMIKKGEFREDLFYRLNVVPIWLPPLRARRDDVTLLARSFCEAFALEHGKAGTTLSDGAMAALVKERWPGNVRQLQNFVERLVVLSLTRTIGEEDVRRELAPPVAFATQGASSSVSATGLSTCGGAPPSSTVTPLDAALRDAERRAIDHALLHAKGNRTLAARLLGVSRATFYTKLEEHGLSKRTEP